MHGGELHLGDIFLGVDTTRVKVEVSRIVVVESFQGFGGKDLGRVDHKDFRVKGKPIAVETLV